LAIAAKHGASTRENSTSDNYRFEQYIAHGAQGAVRIYGALMFFPGKGTPPSCFPAADALEFLSASAL
jgi:hypothetical protein